MTSMESGCWSWSRRLRGRNCRPFSNDSSNCSFSLLEGGQGDKKAMSASRILQPLSAQWTTLLGGMQFPKWRLLLVVFGFAWFVPALSAVVVETRWYHGHQVQCVHGGAWIRQTQLGVYSRARGYEQVFTGTVESVTEVSDTDRRLQIRPDEVFRGHPTGTVTATLNQACITPNDPEIKAGDKWIFYLQTRMYLHPDAKPPYITTDGLMVVFDSPSKPVSQAEYDICLLRHFSDECENCGTPPTRGYSGVFGAAGPQSSALENLVSPSFSLGQLPKRTGPFDEVKLTRIATPPEFLGYEFKSVSATGIPPWPLPPWPLPPCSSDVHSSTGLHDGMPTLFP